MEDFLVLVEGGVVCSCRGSLFKKKGSRSYTGSDHYRIAALSGCLDSRLGRILSRFQEGIGLKHFSAESLDVKTNEQGRKYVSLRNTQYAKKHKLEELDVYISASTKNALVEQGVKSVEEVAERIFESYLFRNNKFADSIGALAFHEVRTAIDSFPFKQREIYLEGKEMKKLFKIARFILLLGSEHQFSDDYINSDLGRRTFVLYPNKFPLESKEDEVRIGSTLRNLTKDEKYSISISEYIKVKRSSFRKYKGKRSLELLTPYIFYLTWEVIIAKFLLEVMSSDNL